MKTTATRILSALIAMLLIGSVAERIVAKEKKQQPPTSTEGATHKPTPTATPHQESSPKKETSSKQASHVERSLRTEVNTGNLHDGSNLIHSSGGLNVTAEVRNHKIVGLIATDDKGKKVPIKEDASAVGHLAGITITDKRICLCEYKTPVGWVVTYRRCDQSCP